MSVLRPALSRLADRLAFIVRVLTCRPVLRLAVLAAGLLVPVHDTTAQAISVVTNATNPGATIARNQCLSISVGNGAAYECGELRVVHPLPTTTTYGKARTPTLIYSSRTARPGAMIDANVALQASLTPTSIQGVVTFNNVTSPGTTYSTAIASYTWQGGWSNGSYRRISMQINALSFGSPTTGLPTGAYHYTFQVSATQNGATSTASDTGTFVVVNRVNSPYGAGWWLDGLEQLVGLDANRLLWVGGDGSTRIYQRVLSGSGVMYAASEMIDRPDSLISQATCPVDCYYARLLPNNSRTYFDGSGNHLLTVNALGHLTLFGWTGSRLASITLPVPSGGLSRAYTFEYANDALGVARLSAVRAPTTAGQDRSTYIRASAGVIDTIRYLDPSDPNTDVVTFTYSAAGGSAPAARYLSSRRNRLGHPTSFTYDAGDGLTSARISMPGYTGADSVIVHSFVPAETRGYPTPIRLDSVWTLWDGPRTDVADVTRFLVNRFGAPDTLIGAVNDTVRITRDAQWKALPASVRQPNGFTTTATYNTRGLPLTTTQVNPLGDGVNATTTYVWDGTFDKPTRITAPMGDTVSASYRSDGQPLWRYANGVRVTFNYASSCATRLSSVSYPDASRDSLQYDAALCNLASSSSPLHAATQYARDNIGRITKTGSPIDANAIDWRYDSTLYDPSDRALRTKSFTVNSADSLVTQNQYDTEGHLLSTSTEAFPHRALQMWTNADIGALARTYAYDPAGRTILESGGGVTWNLAYDPAGNVTRGKDGGVTRTYDAANRLISAVGTDQSTFTYDPKQGTMLAADNNWAQVRRGYYPNGVVKEDTLRIINPTAGTRAYITKYTYDRDGRRKTIVNPNGQTATYDFDAVTGNVASVVDISGLHHRFAFNALGQLDSLIRLSTRSDSVVEKRSYDLGGRLTRRLITQPSAGTMLYDDNLGYDQRDKVVTHNADVLTYGPLGPLVRSQMSSFSSTPETFVSDGLGMQRGRTTVVVSDPSRGIREPSTDSVWYDAGTTRVSATASLLQSGTFPDTTYYDYDGLGNQQTVTSLRHLQEDPNPPPFNGQTGKPTPWALRRVQQRTYQLENRLKNSIITVDTAYVDAATYVSSVYTALESYHYDALGRRVWVRAVMDSSCHRLDPGSGCYSADTYTIWDGSQILEEERTFPSDDPTAAKPAGVTGEQYGTIYYTHAGGVDAPISIDGVNGVVLPYADWRGATDKGSCLPSSCTRYFPGGASSAFRGVPYSSATSNKNWYGSLTEEQTDISGLQYKRNRYYDAKSGTFTQEDPIGLAGGLNLYGYASGDPVNYSDPFGLWPCPELCAVPRLINAVQNGAAWLGGFDTREFFRALGEFGRVMAPLAAGAGGLAGSQAAASGEAQVGTKVYRAFGGESKQMGRFWTTVDPNTTSGFAAKAGLPAGNAVTSVVEGTLTNKAGTVVTTAIPGAQGPGGLPEIQIPFPRAQVDVTAVKPFVVP
jgi:RHS repeat-associated protein